MGAILGSLWGRILAVGAGVCLTLAAGFCLLWVLAAGKAEREALKASLLQAANENNLSTIEFQRSEIQRNGELALWFAGQRDRAQEDFDNAQEVRNEYIQDNPEFGDLLDTPIPCRLLTQPHPHCADDSGAADTADGPE